RRYERLLAVLSLRPLRGTMPDDRSLAAAPDASGGGSAEVPATRRPSRAGELPEVSRMMAGKRGLVMGVANDRSIAWGIAQALHGAGAELAFTYQGEAFKKRVIPLVTPLNPAALIDCDVSNQGSLDALFDEIGKIWDSLDFVVHAI